MADYLVNFGHFVLMISLDLVKLSEVRIAGDQPIYPRGRMVDISVWWTR